MPIVEQALDLCCLDPISTDISRDLDNCITSAESDYGYITHTTTLTRDVDGKITATAHDVVDA